MSTCPHYWTVTSECPKCLRMKLDEARAEVETLRAVIEGEPWGGAVLKRQRDEARAALKDVAERQREACAEACEKVLEEAERYALTPGRIKTGIGAAGECVDEIRDTPLVTEGG